VGLGQTLKRDAAGTQGAEPQDASISISGKNRHERSAEVLALLLPRLKSDEVVERWFLML